MPHQGYGLTETNGAVAFNRGPEYLERPTSTGKPYPICDVRIVDPDNPTGPEMKHGEKGEVLVKGPLVMREYYNKPKATAEAIIDRKGKDGFGWFRTGDLGKMDSDGYLHIVGRAKDIIIRGGENISATEVENAFYMHKGVLECGAVGVEDHRLGERVGIVVVPTPDNGNGGPVLSAKMLRDFVVAKQQLAGFKIPDFRDIIVSKELLPRGATGKILKREIRAIFKKRELKSKL